MSGNVMYLPADRVRPLASHDPGNVDRETHGRWIAKALRGADLTLPAGA